MKHFNTNKMKQETINTQHIGRNILFKKTIMNGEKRVFPIAVAWRDHCPVCS